MAGPAEDPKDATPSTQAQNRAVLDALPFADTQDFEDARRGFLGTLPEVEIKNDRGRVVWSLTEYGFLGEEEAPPTVNPSLWRQARLNMSHGLFQVTDRIYQIRGFDINTYPIRGAQVRDANAWSRYLNEALDRFGREAEVVFAQHHWPVWDNHRVLDFLTKQRDLYKYLHDQTVRLMNHGWKAAEIAERLALPKSLAGTWHVRGYYGTLSHNSKSVYQRYLGWYDANPANLNPLPPVERGRKYVEYMGGAGAAIARARRDFEGGEYRFVAEAMSHVVFADPSNTEGRQLGADALEQLGYAAESATWRNAYLLGAFELRKGQPNTVARAGISPDVVRAMSLEHVFDYLGVRLNGDRAEGRRIVINWVFPDVARPYVLNLENCALTYLADRRSERADATVTLDRATLDRLILREATPVDAAQGGLARIEGDAAKVAELFSLLDDFALKFEVVEPKRPA